MAGGMGLNSVIRYSVLFTTTGDSAVDKALSKQALGSQNLAMNLSRLGNQLLITGGLFTTLFTIPIVKGFKQALKLSSDYNEALNKVDVVYGELSGEAMKWAESSQKAFGLSKVEAMDSIALYGDMATGMGFTNTQALKLATSITGMIRDVGSFKNMSDEMVATGLKGIFTGETESIKNLGVVMTESNIANWLFAQGLYETESAALSAYKSMSQTEKVMTRYNFVADALSNSQGDFNRTLWETWEQNPEAVSFANVIKYMGSVMKDLGVIVGDRLRPKLSALLMNTVIPFLETLRDMPEEDIDRLIDGLFKLASLGVKIMALGGAFKFLSAVITASQFASAKIEVFKKSIDDVKKSLYDLGKNGFGKLNQLSNGVFPKMFNSAKESIKSFGNTLKTGLGNGIKSLGTTIKSLAKGDLSPLKNALDSTKEKVSGVISKVNDLGNKALIGVSSKLSLIGNSIKDTFSKVKDIKMPKFSLEGAKGLASKGMDTVKSGASAVKEGAVSGGKKLLEGGKSLGGKALEGGKALAGGMKDALGTATKFVAKIGALGLAFGVVLAVVLLIGLAFSSFISTFKDMMKNNDEFREKVQGLVDKFKEFGSAIKEIIDKFGNKLAEALGFDGMEEMITAVVDFIDEKLGEVLTWIEENEATIDMWIETAVSFVMGVADLISTIFGFVKAFVIFVGNILSTVFEGTLGNVIGMFKSFWLFVKGVFTLLKGIFTGDTQLMKEGFRMAIDGIKGFFTNLGSFIKKTLGNIKDAVVSKAKAIGKAILDGIVEGVSKLADKLKDVVSGAVDGVKSFLGINSPSRLFKEIGMFMGQGMNIGFSDEIDEVENKVKDSSENIRKLLSPASLMGDSQFGTTLKQQSKIYQVNYNVGDLNVDVNGGSKVNNDTVADTVIDRLINEIKPITV